ncbi:MAG: NADH-ubiquinone oxidoreductase-F iron-sulfur binding region domain-containing protein [Candidatus Brocadiia bacterium]
MDSLFSNCCTKCSHTAETPCPKFVECRTEGPLCHESDHCRQELDRLRKEALYVNRPEPVFFVGAGTCGLAAGAGALLKSLKAELARKTSKAEIVEVGCIGYCAHEPLIDVLIPGRKRVLLADLKPEDVQFIVESAYSGDFTKLTALDKVVGEHQDGTAISDVPELNDNPFFSRQYRIVLENCGIINPASMAAYVAKGGYRALAKALKTMTRAEVCDEVKRSGLRGRGGAGFPTGQKWEVALKAEGPRKYIVCNADEGDPGAFMDRAVLESDPHRVIEGMITGAYGINANEGYIYCRAEYPLAIAMLRTSIADAEKAGLLGDNILDSGFSFHLKIKMGAGAFVCGEETALLASIEGRRGMPRPRPPFPAQRGLFGCPTVINNVETFANIPWIVRNGSGKFSAMGTNRSKGTKVFALSGKVRRTGLVEVPMGTSIRTVIYDIGGGPPEGHTFKAVQIGGPSGGCIPEQHLDTPIDYEALKELGAIMGSGGLVTMDDETCMVDVARFFMTFIQQESCGKCIPCREGTKRLLETLERICHGKKSEKEADALIRFRGVTMMQQLAETIRDTSLCGLGQTAANPVLSTLKYFRDEYEAHIYMRKCPAGYCRELRTFQIDAAKCKGCGICSTKCPEKAIVGEKKHPFHIKQESCVSCGVCFDSCPFAAIETV